VSAKLRTCQSIANNSQLQVWRKGTLPSPYVSGGDQAAWIRIATQASAIVLSAA
jgi:hypothetical protein